MEVLEGSAESSALDVLESTQESLIENVEKTDDDDTQATAVEEEEEVDLVGKVLPFEVLNGYPMYQMGHSLYGKLVIFERVGWDDRFGPTYLALNKEGKELIIRMGNADDSFNLMETAFLCRAEKENKWSHFSQIHSFWKADGYSFLVTYFRQGPSLKQCFQFCSEKFSHGTAGRLAKDVLEIMHIVHEYGYLLRCVNLESFHFDGCNRHLFLADMSELKKDITKTPDDKIAKILWGGGPVFAPLSYHNNENLYCRDEYEAWFYMFIHMVKGLSWNLDRSADIKWNKIGAHTDKSMTSDLPEEYEKIFNIITTKDNTEAVTEEEYQEIVGLVDQIIKEHGKIEDHEENMDFERDPDPEELPRFVLERADAGNTTQN